LRTHSLHSHKQGKDRGTNGYRPDLDSGAQKMVQNKVGGGGKQTHSGKDSEGKGGGADGKQREDVKPRGQKVGK